MAAHPTHERYVSQSEASEAMKELAKAVVREVIGVVLENQELLAQTLTEKGWRCEPPGGPATRRKGGG